MHLSVQVQKNGDVLHGLHCLDTVLYVLKALTEWLQALLALLFELLEPRIKQVKMLCRACCCDKFTI